MIVLIAFVILFLFFRFFRSVSHRKTRWVGSVMLVVASVFLICYILGSTGIGLSSLILNLFGKAENL